MQSKMVAGCERQFVISAKNTESAVITSFILTPEDGKPVKDFIPGQYLFEVNTRIWHMKKSANIPYPMRQNGTSYRISVKREPADKCQTCCMMRHVGDKIA